MLLRLSAVFCLMFSVSLVPPVAAQKGGEPVKKSSFEGWGPSWWTGLPPGGFQRGVMKTDRTEMYVTDAGKGEVVTIGLWCDVADQNLKADNTYQLMYQLRLLGEKGMPGQLLATKAFPNGIALGVSQKQSNGKECEMEGKCLISKQLLKEFTNLPVAPWVVVRFEPQLRNVTTGQYLLPGKTQAIVLVVELDPQGGIHRVCTFGDFLSSVSSVNIHLAEKFLTQLDDFHYWHGELAANWLLLLENNQQLTPEERARLIPMLPHSLLTGDYPEMRQLLEKLAVGTNSALQMAARNKLASLPGKSATSRPR